MYLIYYKHLTSQDNQVATEIPQSVILLIATDVP
jgi:hypothetical protein